MRESWAVDAAAWIAAHFVWPLVPPSGVRRCCPPPPLYPSFLCQQLMSTLKSEWRAEIASQSAGFWFAHVDPAFFRFLNRLTNQMQQLNTPSEFEVCLV